MSLRHVMVLAAVMVIGGQVVLGQGTASKREAINWLPRTANAVVLIDAQGLFDSEMSKTEGWLSGGAKDRAERPVDLPRGTTKVMTAARLNLRDLHTVWEVAVVKTDGEITIDEIAEKNGGYLDLLGDKEALLTPEDIYVISMDKNTFAAVYPGDRQFAASWLHTAGSDGSVYLQGVIEYAYTSPAQVVMAMDLSNAVIFERAAETLGASEILANASVDIDALTEVVASLRGVRLSVEVKDKAWGRLEVDFGKKLDLQPRLAQLIVMNVIKESGAYIEEVDLWSVQVAYQKIVLEGELSTDGLRRVMSLVEFATPKVDDEQEEDTSGLSEEASASLDHFHEVAVLIEDLRQKDQAQSYQNVALWFDRYANKIDRLSIVNVDPQLVEYSGQVASLFRNGSRQVNDISAKMSEEVARVKPVTVQKSSSRSSYRTSAAVRGRSSGVEREVRQERERQYQQRRQVGLAAKGEASNVILEVMGQVDDLTRQIRADMTQKYEVEFQ